jgi:hypothetical protein
MMVTVLLIMFIVVILLLFSVPGLIYIDSQQRQRLIQDKRETWLASDECFDSDQCLIDEIVRNGAKTRTETDVLSAYSIHRDYGTPENAEILSLAIQAVLDERNLKLVKEVLGK